MKLTACVFLFWTLVGISEGYELETNQTVHCVVSVWSDWFAHALDGTWTRTRTVDIAARNGGDPCPSFTETQSGSTDPLSQDNASKKFHEKFLRGQIQHHNVRRRSIGARRSLPRDLLVIVDMSRSISTADWLTTKINLAELIERLCGSIGPGVRHNRIAIITFSGRVVLNFNFKTYFSIDSVRQAILNMPQDPVPLNGGRTCTGDALAYANQYMFTNKTGIRSAFSSVKEVLVLTDGESNCGADLALNVRRLQEKAFVYALAIGNLLTSGRAAIESMASRPLIEHIFSLANFIHFTNMVDAAKLYPSSCVPFELY